MSPYESVTVNSLLHALPPYSLLRNDMRKQKIIQLQKKLFDFGTGDPLEETPEFIRQALVSGIRAVSQYPINTGMLALREACAAWIKRRFKVTIHPQHEIISCNGSKEAIFHIPQVLFNSSSVRKIVVFPDPGYPVYKSSVLLAGGVPWAAPLRSEKNYIFDPADIPSEILPYISAVWLCYPHNPTGAVIDVSSMQKIYGWALKHNIILLADECYVDMFTPGTDAPTSFLQVAQSEQFRNLIVFHTLSKRSGMTGYRSGFVAGAQNLIEFYAKYRPHVGLGTPDFVQSAAIAAWSDDNHVLERNRIFADKRSVVEGVLSAKGISFLRSQATFYVWGQVPARYKSGEDFAEELATLTGAIVTPGDALGDSCTDRFRMALVPSLEEIREWLELWQKV